MKLLELLDRNNRYCEAVRQIAPSLIREQAQTGKTLIQERSIQEGITANGSQPTYSKQPVYRSSFTKSTLNGAGQKWVKEGRGKKGTWEELRQVQGREGGKVNLFYRGRTWASLQVVDGPMAGAVFSAYVTPSDVESARIFAGNLKRYGNFMVNTEQELIRIKGDTANELATLFKYIR